MYVHNFYKQENWIEIAFLNYIAHLLIKVKY